MIRTTTAATPWPLPLSEGKTIFMLRAGDVIERGEWEAELTQMGAGRIYGWQFLETFFAGLTALLPNNPEDVERIREIQTALDGGEKVSAEDQSLIDGAKEAVRKHWPAYRELLAQQQRRTELAPIIAFMWFCDGWEGVDISGKPLPAFRKTIDGRVALDLVKELSPLCVHWAGKEAFDMLYAIGDAKNSERLSQPDESPKPSKRVRSKRAGSSAVKSGSRTRSSSSRPGRSRS